MSRSRSIAHLPAAGRAALPPQLDPSRILWTLESMARPEARSQGMALHRQNRVHLVTEQPGTDSLTVRGLVQTDRSKPYEAALYLRRGRAEGRCTCRPAPRPCGHVLALALAWEEKRTESLADRFPRPLRWKPLLEGLVPGPIPALPPAGQTILVHWIDVVGRQPGLWSLTIRWRLHRVGARGIGRGRLVDPAIVFSSGAERGDADRQVYETALQGLSLGRHAGSAAVEVAGARVDPLLRALARVPWVRWEASGAPVKIELDPVRPRLRARDLGSELRFALRWGESGEEPEDPEAVRVIGSKPPWVERGGRLRPVTGVEDGQALALLLRQPPPIPEEDLPAFLGTTVPNLEARGIAVEVSGLGERNLVLGPTATPRLYLSEEKGVLVANLRFAYGDFEISAENPMPVLALGTGREKRFLRRDMEAEFQAASRLRTLGFRAADPGRFEIEGDTALDFVRTELEPLSSDWEVFGRDDLRKYRINRSSLALGLRVSASTDWLDLQVEARTEEEEIPLQEVLRAFRAGSRYVRLGRGGHALLPREWLERVGTLLGDLRAEEGQARIAPYMAPLVEELLEDACRVEISGREAWERLVSGLRAHGEPFAFPLPTGFQGVLRPYQETGYRWLRFLGEAGLGGILADDMGLGKTVQTLALFVGELEAGRTRPNLVVAPTSVVPNWEAEARRFAPQLRVRRYHGADRKAGLGELDDAHLVLTSYALLRRDVPELERVGWNYVVLDEGQAIKNASTQTARAARRVEARRRLTLTGTPLENHLGELWSQFQFLMPGLLGSERRFAEHYARPATQGDDQARSALARRIRPFILRRLKSEVASELPEKVENVLLCQMGPEQERLYRSLLMASRERVLGEVARKGFARSRVCILDALLRLRQVCCHPAVLPGGLGLGTPSAKFELFRDFVSEVVEEGHRVLVFSQFVRVLEILRTWFREAGIPHLHLDGKTTDREARVRRFQEDDSISAFLVSLKAGGTGLNLTGADYVILYDPWWNPAVEAQAADRAHRIGQTRKVFAYKLITQGTVEEKILALQERKQSLTEDLVRSDEQWGSAFTEEDLEELFRT